MRGRPFSGFSLIQQDDFTRTKSHIWKWELVLERPLSNSTGSKSLGRKGNESGGKTSAATLCYLSSAGMTPPQFTCEWSRGLLSLLYVLGRLCSSPVTITATEQKPRRGKSFSSVNNQTPFQSRFVLPLNCCRLFVLPGHGLAPQKKGESQFQNRWPLAAEAFSSR